jgi:hypothetical protein
LYDLGNLPSSPRSYLVRGVAFLIGRNTSAVETGRVVVDCFFATGRSTSALLGGGAFFFSGFFTGFVVGLRVGGMS